MLSANQVDASVAQWKNDGMASEDIVWNLALACEGWPYVFGAAGALCTPKNRRARARDDHPTIVTKCQVLNGDRNYCNGCKWLPGGENVRQYDCRGFTRWCAAQVGVTIEGVGATSQWNTESNWAAKGTIDTVPTNQLVFLFVQNGSKMAHTGLGLGNETVECSVNVQHFTKRNKKWTHWAVAKGLEGGATPTPTPQPVPATKPTLRRGSSGEYVKYLQEKLIALGYSVGSYGADGKYGNATIAAVKKFQADRGLTADGVTGAKTWAEIDREIEPTTDYYTATITGLTKDEADQVSRAYPGAVITKE